MNVEYRTIDRFPGYRFGSDGSVWSCHKNRHGPAGPWRQLNTRKHLLRGENYLRVFINAAGGQRYIHRLILEAFVGPCPPGALACHSDGNPLNNRPENLRWDTPAENSADSLIHGTRARGERMGSATHRPEDVIEAHRLRVSGLKLREIGEGLGFSQSHLSNIFRGKSWAHLRRPPMALPRRSDLKLDGDDLREAFRLRNQGWTPRAIAGKLGVTHNYMLEIFRGKKASVAKRVAAALQDI